MIRNSIKNAQQICVNLPDSIRFTLDSLLTETLRCYYWRNSTEDSAKLMTYEYVLMHTISEIYKIDETYVREAYDIFKKTYSYGNASRNDKTREEYMEVLRNILESEAIAC